MEETIFYSTERLAYSTGSKEVLSFKRDSYKEGKVLGVFSSLYLEILSSEEGVEGRIRCDRTRRGKRHIYEVLEKDRGIPYVGFELFHPSEGEHLYIIVYGVGNIEDYVDKIREVL